MKNSNKTDWQRLANMRDEDIDYSDIPETDEAFWAGAQTFQPQTKVPVTLHIDEDLAEWIAQLGNTSDTVVNDLLRAYFKGLQQLQGHNKE